MAAKTAGVALNVLKFIELISHHNMAILALGIVMCFSTCYLVAIFLHHMKSITLRRRLALTVVIGAMGGFGMWNVSHLLISSIDPFLPISLDLTMVFSQIAACVIYYCVLSTTAFSPVRWHHQVGLFLVPFFPALVNFWAVGNLLGGELADFSVLGKASLAFAAGGGLMALLAPRDPAKDVAPAIPFAGVQVMVVLALHFSMLHAYGVDVEALTGLSSRADTAPAAIVMLPITIANILMIAVAAASFFAETEATQEAVRYYRKLALEDRLTGLPNRAGLNAKIGPWLEPHGKAHAFAVALIDLDRFKEVNDLHGHAAGDELLIALTRHLLSCFSEGESLYRLGGDEFIALKTDISHRDQALAFGQFVCDTVRTCEMPVAREIKVGASVGVSTYPEDGKTLSALMARADLAMYAAKHGGRNLSVGFVADMESNMRRKAALSGDLDGAISRGELAVHYQPQIDALSGDVVAFEALMRWSHPDLGNVAPSEFILIAEESGQINELGEWILREACREAASWDMPCGMSVNVAPGQLSRGNFASVLKDILKTTGLQPARLVLEVTESGFKKDKAAALATLRQCQEMGVAIAMDDFGTGYSSLSMLHEASFDCLKIDKRFVQDLMPDGNTSVIVSTVLALGAANGMYVVAEGVETPEQRDFLTKEGCDVLQGYLFGAAAPAADIRSRFGLISESVSGRVARI